MSATTSPPGPSPNLSSPYDLTQTPSSEDDSWQYLDYSSSGSVGVLPSPASGSLNGYAVVGYLGSPHYLDLDQPQFPAGGSMSGGSVGPGEGEVGSARVSVDGGDPFVAASEAAAAASFLAPQHLLFTEAQMAAMGFTADNMALPTNLPTNLATNLPTGLDILNQQSIFDNLDPFRTEDIGPWDPTSVGSIPAAHLISPALNSMSSSSQDSPSPLSGLSKTPPPTRKVEAGKVEKARKKKKKARATAADAAGGQAGRFVIMTPTTITAQAGRPNPFECFEEAHRTSHKGRKGPLANATKESALQVRRLGACFCCHSRKVKCDMERPCRNCVRLAAHVPQVICWQFQDFQTVLFPVFVRAHFGREEMARFMEENVDGFGVDGVADEEGGGRCSVELFSGPRFRSVLVIPGARFFRPRTSEVLRHWHLHAERGGVDLQAKGAVPIGLDPSRGTQREEVKKRAKEYVRSILAEPAFADQLTETFRHTGLPRRILQIVQKFWLQSEATVVRKALSIYTLHYILTRHLCMTRPNIISLAGTNLVPQHVPWVTPRVLNRQVKAVMDDLMQRETQLIFDLFSKNLKPKSRKEWAPCLAAFLVLCLFMESVETAADNFVVAQNEIRMRGAADPADGEKEYGRDFALGINEEIEKLPFRQFAYQFHQVYQTHSKDSSARAFNPLMDDEFAERGEVDDAGREMVEELRELLEGPFRPELDDLVMDPILPNHESHPYPRDVAVDYTGRLASRFLLSFTDEKYIFDQTA